MILNRFLLIAFACAFVHAEAQNASTSKPNIIYILADDLGYGDLGCYGQTKIPTPNIDALAAGGILFTDHYAGSTVCAPSRATILTGLHTGHVSVRGNREVQPEGQAPLLKSEPNLIALMKKAGYSTGLFGKWGLGYPGSVSDPMAMGFDVFFGYNCQRRAHAYYPDYLWSNDQKVDLSANNGAQTATYSPIVIQEAALDFIEKHAKKPFFMFYASTLPHAELAAPSDEIAEFSGIFGKESPYPGQPDPMKRKNGSYGGQTKPRAAYAAMVSHLDKQVGDIMARVEALGIAENTIIIFSSDNGPSNEGGGDPNFFDSNGKLRGTKRDLSEGGIRVPFIANWPGTIEAGSQSDHLSAQWDMLATFCDLVGVAPTAGDGLSFKPLFLGKPAPEHEFLYWEFTPGTPAKAVRMGDWKAIITYTAQNPEGELALYNLRTDLGEQDDLSGANPEIVEQLKAIIAQEHIESKDFPFPNEQ